MSIRNGRARARLCAGDWNGIAPSVSWRKWVEPEDDSPSELASFLTNVHVQPGPNACWIWIGLLDERGYGRTTYKGRPMRAHRASYIVHRGDVPKGRVVAHHCDNPTCVNPNHLYAGTHKDNSADYRRRGLSRKMQKKFDTAILLCKLESTK